MALIMNNMGGSGSVNFEGVDKIELAGQSAHRDDYQAFMRIFPTDVNCSSLEYSGTESATLVFADNTTQSITSGTTTAISKEVKYLQLSRSQATGTLPSFTIDVTSIIFS